MKKIRAGIIGCGRIASVYKEVFKGLQEEVQLVWAVDKEIERAKTFAADFGGGYSSGIDELINIKPDIIHICTPHYLHKDQAIACMKAGISVLCEKPIATNLEDADEMIAVQKATKMRIGIIFQNRYIEGIIKAKELIQDGKLGKITGAFSNLNWHRPPSYYACDWKGSWEKEGGGVLIDQAIHSIDLVQWMIGSKVQSIKGHIDNRILKMIEVEDVADAAVIFENGACYALSACNYYKSNAPIQIEIYGEKGVIHLDENKVSVNIEEGMWQIMPTLNIEDFGENYWGKYHYVQIKECYQAIRDGKGFNVSLQEARKSLEIVLGVYRSSRENTTVFIK